MRLIESYMAKNPIYAIGEKIRPDGLVIQTLWRPQPSAKVMVHNWNRETHTDICPHAFIDANSGDVYQTLPFDMRGKHSGTALNNHTIGVMICEPLGIKHSKGEVIVVGDKEKVQESLAKTYNAAVELFASLCLKYNIDPLKKITIYAKRNPEKLWAFMKLPTDLIDFRSDILVKMGEMKSTISSKVEEVNQKIVDGFNQGLTKSEDSNLQSIRIDVPNLRIRTGPSKECKAIGKFTGIGTFLIDKVQNGSGSTKGWGRLTSGDGWVSLDHVTFL